MYVYKPVGIPHARQESDAKHAGSLVKCAENTAKIQSGRQNREKTMPEVQNGGTGLWRNENWRFSMWPGPLAG